MNAYISSNQLVLTIILLIWTIPWKIYSLWIASKRNDRAWFIAIVILNTVGLLEIIYIFFVAKKSWTDVKKAFTSIIAAKK